MKDPTWSDPLLSAHRSHLVSDAGRQAFDTLVSRAVASPAYNCAAGWHGDIRDFFYNSVVAGNRPFAFIVNRSSLLFYARLPGQGAVPGGLAGLRAQFSGVNENTLGEWTVRIRTPEEAERLNELLFPLAAPISGVGSRGGVIPAGITAADVLGALKRLDAGEDHGFGESTGYDVDYDGKRYSPKAVVALAAERLLGRILSHKEFSGGHHSQCNTLLRALGFEVVAKVAPVPEAKSWWVNHKKTHRQEIDGEYIWSPKRNQNGAKNATYDSMAKVMAGDVVFSFAGGKIKAVGVAKGRAREAVQPPEFGTAGEEAWGTDPGWQVPIRFVELASPVRAKDHAKDWTGVLPAKHSPIRETGDGNQGVYLAAVPEAMGAVIRRLLGAQYQDALDRIQTDLGPDLEAEAAEEQLAQRTDIGPTEKLRLSKARRGQGIYKKNLEQIEKGCRVTGVTDGRFLRASHIKPWAKSSDFEKLDGYNGLLLTPNADNLFDAGLISFSDSGDLLVSDNVPGGVLTSMGLTRGMTVGGFRPEQCVYLEWHRKAYGFSRSP